MNNTTLKMRIQGNPRFAFVCLAMIGGALVWLATRNGFEARTPTEHANLSRATLQTGLPELLSFSATELGGVDIGIVNLICGMGLPWSDIINTELPLAELDRMDNQVKAETDRHYRKFQRKPKDFNNSEAYFRMLCLVTVLQQDFGVAYSPHRAKPSDGPIEPNETFFADSRDIFLHGLLGAERTGTCASLPVLYIAVGRRLGYPLKLVAAKNHLFLRWENARERLNIEATTQGLATFEDDYYRRWPFPMTADEERTERYLTSLSPSEELSVFLSLRTQCLLAAGRWDEALFSQEQVCRLAPHSASQREILERVRSQAKPSERRKQNHQTALNL
jgi:hypothetical protein